nr:EbsA family protein [Vagococcus allomyrinae]
MRVLVDSLRGTVVTKKETNQKFRWQPELATSIIYWSLTFGTFFLSSIAAFEALGLSVLCVSFFICFAILTYLGQSRHFSIQDDRLIVHAILKRNRHQFDLRTIEKISLGAYGLTFIFDGHHEIEESDRTVLMSKKTLANFISALEQSAEFKGIIVSIKKS